MKAIEAPPTVSSPFYPDTASPSRIVRYPVALKDDVDTAADANLPTPLRLGATLTYEQSWNYVGLSWGSLLYSVSLAPAESTQIAVIDWDRRTMDSRFEKTEDAFKLTKQTDRAHVATEVSDAVANEVQSGFSRMDSLSSFSQEGESRGGLFGSALGIATGLMPLTLGGTSSSGAASRGSVTSTTAVAGVRVATTSVASKINDATLVSALETRGRYSAVVLEGSQAESVQASTRLVANYNRMHMLNLLYFEVVQVFTVKTGRKSVRPCAFIPMGDLPTDKILASSDLCRCLAPFALSEFVRRTLTDYPEGVIVTLRSVGYAPPAAVQTPQDVWISSVDVSELSNHDPKATGPCVLSYNLSKGMISFPPSALGGFPQIGSDGKSIPGADGKPAVDHITFSVMDTDKSGMSINSHTTEFSDRPLTDLFNVVAPNGATIRFTIAGIVLFTMTITGAINTSVTSAPACVCDPRIGDHLNRYKSLFTRGLAGQASIDLLWELFTPTWPANPAGGVFDPASLNLAKRPFAAIGEDFLFAITADAVAQTWKDFDEPTDDGVEVCLPTGGVFAEAVLGQNCSAEEIDLKRFGQWDDAKLPQMAAPVTDTMLASRYQNPSTVLGPGNPPTPVSTDKPDDPASGGGTGAVTGQGAATIVDNGNLFRDMAGLAASADVLKASMAGTERGAANAGATAEKSYEATLDFAMKVVGAVQGGGAGGKLPTSTPRTIVASAGGRSLVALGGLMNEEKLQAFLDKFNEPGTPQTGPPVPPPSKAAILPVAPKNNKT